VWSYELAGATVTASTTSSMTSDDYPGRGGIKITIVRE